MDEDTSCEYSESFDSFISGGSKNVKSVITEVESHDTSIHSQNVDTDCLSSLSTERSGRWTESHGNVEEGTPNLSTSWSKLRFSRYFSESEKHTVGSDAELNRYCSSFESLTGCSEDESIKDDEDLTVFSAASDTDTQTCSSVSQELSVRWKDDDEVDEFSSDSQHLTSKGCSDVFRLIIFIFK